jgi:phage tail-like protein
MAYYPPVGFHFKVKFNGLDNEIDDDIRFQEVGGLAMEIGVEEIVEGGENHFVHRLPTRGKFNNLVLKRGLLRGSGLIKWFRNALESFEFKPLTVHVVLLNEKHEPLQQWTFQKVWPVKWIISDLKALDNSLVVETIELSYQRFTRDDT